MKPGKFLMMMVMMMMANYATTTTTNPLLAAVPLASARQHPENRKENQAGHSSERTVEGQGTVRKAT